MSVRQPLVRAARRLVRWREVPTHYCATDILLASFPRSGNTWLRFIVSNVARLLIPDGPAVDFHSLPRYAPEIRRNRELRDVLRPRGHPLFLKTHSDFVPGFGRYASVMIHRAPADALASFHAYLRGERRKRVPELSAFLRSARWGMPAWCEFSRSWRGRATVELRYENLLDDPQAVVSGMFADLGCAVPEELVARAVQASSKANMRRALDERGDPHRQNPDFAFVGRGRKGGGGERLSEEDRAYVARLAEELRS